MPNKILNRWAEVLSVSEGNAVFSTSGEVLRTWNDMETEARDLQTKMSGCRGAVALQTGNQASFPALVLACLRAGRPVVLFDAGLSGEMRRRMEAQLGVTLRVTVLDGQLCFEELAGAAGKPAEVGSNVCFYKLTSGTTSLPRAIGFTAEQLVADCDQVCASMGIRKDDLNYGIVAFTHSYGFSNLITPLLCRGVPLVVAGDPLPRAMESGLAVTGATVLAAVPAMFRGLLSADSLPPTLRLCISAGAPLDPALARSFFERFGQKIHTFYGASECGGICYDASDGIDEIPGFVGTALQGVTIEIPVRQQGAKILVRSKAIGEEMCNSEGGYEPSDLLIRERGGYRIVGRESDLINVAGRKVNPQEIEQALARFPEVTDVVVCGADDSARGQEVCALVSADVPPDILSLRRHCAGLMASWKVPRRFAFVREIPRNARGKISREEIAKSYF
ncbi:MAG: class I adenylate-forming enzyme family protein [Terrimicrobiaceae bacterium]